MESKTTERFRKAFEKLPDKVKEDARKVFKLWKTQPYLNSLRFKKIHDSKNIYSVRIGLSYRALGVREGDAMIWFWIGSHHEYDSLVSNLK